MVLATLDASKPVDGVPAEKLDLRNALATIKSMLRAVPQTNTGTSITINAVSFGVDTNAEKELLIILCTGATAITVTLGADVPAGKMVEVVRKGNGNVTGVAGAGASLAPAAGQGNWPAALHSTTDLDESLVYGVDTNTTGSNAAWRQRARP